MLEAHCSTLPSTSTSPTPGANSTSSRSSPPLTSFQQTSPPPPAILPQLSSKLLKCKYSPASRSMRVRLNFRRVIIWGGSLG
ncbi:hypothetical protein FGO68_gene15575 [Halteria grandinella]|uniref:Uncharacterized protein n=1 Tax=Halteria grandinella TaxID=5974 RepID=A0A8J8NBE7_HALGN|nr:hypothetical protein FGO68_gene15575 [Halteria grandinella]